MTVAPNVEILADHSFWLAVPALAPALVVAGIVVYIAVKNRRKSDEGTGTNTEGEL